MEKMTDLIGWASTIILLLTVSSQVLQQWRSKSSAGVSHWLFTGQLAASTGFVVYSAAQGDWVFVVSNVLMLLTALTGQYLYLHNRHRGEDGKEAASPDGAHNIAKKDGRPQA
jgi:uncharacterized protein with PQ loop repeat